MNHKHLQGISLPKHLQGLNENFKKLLKKKVDVMISHGEVDDLRAALSNLFLHDIGGYYCIVLPLYKCTTCGNKSNFAYLLCSRCTNTYYCCKDCQIKDYPTHKHTCNTSNKDKIKEFSAWINNISKYENSGYIECIVAKIKQNLEYNSLTFKCDIKNSSDINFTQEQPDDQLKNPKDNLTIDVWINLIGENGEKITTRGISFYYNISVVYQRTIISNIKMKTRWVTKISYISLIFILFILFIFIYFIYKYLLIRPFWL